MENSRQPNPMQGVHSFAFPEKLGEVFAGLYILLVSKILRNIGKQKDVFKEFKVQGVLVSKECGGIHCILSVQLKKNVSSGLHFNATASCVILEPSNLCTLLHNLI